MGEIITVYIPSALRRKIDIERGEIPRNRYVLRILEKYHNGLEDEA